MRVRKRKTECDYFLKESHVMIRNWCCSFILCSYETVFLIAFVLSCAMALRLTSKWLERFPLASCILVRLHTTTSSPLLFQKCEHARSRLAVPQRKKEALEPEWTPFTPWERHTSSLTFTLGDHVTTWHLAYGRVLEYAEKLCMCPIEQVRVASYTSSIHCTSGGVYVPCI